ncbi:hypothetical protein CEN47_24870, partial [Fischerella thermalis CCMEE 5319]
MVDFAESVGCEDFFGIQGEFGIEYPGVVAGVAFEDFFEGLPFVFAEVECFFSVGVVDDETGEVGVLVFGGELAQESDIVLELLVALELCFENFVRGGDVGFGG